MAMDLSDVLKFGPTQTNGFVDFSQDKVFQVRAETSPPSLSPITYQRPKLELRARLRRDNLQPSLNVRLIGSSTRVAFEAERDYVGINQHNITEEIAAHSEILRGLSSRRRASSQTKNS